jgi:LPS-assembly lipoprotein
MWWSRSARSAAKTALQAAAAVSLLLTVNACGFRPLHAPSDDARSTPADRLATIRINPLEGRVGQQLHNLLRDRLNASGQPRDPAYALQIALRITTQELGIRKDETATRANLTLSARFELRDLDSRAVLLAGRSVSVNSYDIFDAFYATTVAEEDAVRRGLRVLADDIGLRLAVHFAGPSAAEKP